MSIYENDLDLPATRRDVISLRDELRGEIAASSDELRSEIAASRDELRSEIATSRDELRSEIAASRDELRAEILANRDEMRRYIDILVENFRSEFKNLFDWTQATTSTMGARIDRLEDERHGPR